MTQHPVNLKDLKSVLARFELARARASQSEDIWHEAFFGHADPGADKLSAAESERLSNRVAYNATRRRFHFLSRRFPTPAVRFDIPSPVELAAAYARIHRRPEEQFGLPDQMPEVQVSNRFATGAGVDYWIRFPSPSIAMDDLVYARVHEPKGVVDPPTLIFLHGVCVEFDHWKGMINDTAQLVKNGVRVIRMEAPWHGRRVPEGRYGGEKFIGTMPLGTLQFFSAQIREAGVIMSWVRSFSKSAVAVGGSSLGAHVARLIATRCVSWPRHLHPDALFLITPCGRLEDAAIHGAFARIWKNVEAAAEAGWSDELRHKWMSLIDPMDHPVVDPDRIIAVVGKHDRVTPYDSGSALLKKLGLPAENRFDLDQGHFSTPLRLVRDHRPLTRMVSLLRGGSYG